MEPAQQSAPPSTVATAAMDGFDMDDGTATEAGDMMVRRRVLLVFVTATSAASGC